MAWPRRGFQAAPSLQNWQRMGRRRRSSWMDATGTLRSTKTSVDSTVLAVVAQLSTQCHPFAVQAKTAVERQTVGFVSARRRRGTHPVSLRQCLRRGAPFDGAAPRRIHSDAGVPSSSACTCGASTAFRYSGKNFSRHFRDGQASRVLLRGSDRSEVHSERQRSGARRSQFQMTGPPGSSLDCWSSTGASEY